MKSILQQVAERSRLQEKAKTEAVKAEIKDPTTSNNRRSFLKKAVMGGIALGGMMRLSVEDSTAQTTSKVQRASGPSDLKITDMRYALTAVMGGYCDYSHRYKPGNLWSG
jgi:hypothetical protein